MRRIFCVLLGAIALSTIAVPTGAETRLKEQVSQYRETLRSHTQVQAVTPQQLEATRQEVLQASAEFDKFLSRGNAKNTDAWKQYLEWSPMRESLAESTPDVDVLKAALRKYYRDEQGLELDPFTRFRARLDEYVMLQEYATSQELGDADEALLDDLAYRLARYDVEPRRGDALAIGRVLTYLEVSGSISPELLAALRKRFDRPNGYLRVNNNLVSQMLRRDVDDTRSFSRADGQVTTRGTARTVGKVFTETAPSRQGAAFDVRLQGTIASPNLVSTQRNVTVYSSCLTNVNAWKRVLFTDEGFTLTPARALCRSNISINGVSARGPFIELMAERRAGREVPNYEQQSSGIARREITSQIDDEVTTAMKEANHVYVDYFRKPLIRFGALPQRMDFFTTLDHVGAVIHMAGDNRLGAPDERPTLDPGFDIGMVMHESLMDNYCRALLAGKTIQDAQWANIMSILTGTEPRALWVHDRTAPWSFTFHEERPIEVDFRDGLLTISLRSHEVTRAKKAFPETVLVRAIYRIDLGRDGAVFVRQGALTTKLDGNPSAETVEQHADLIAFLHKKFGGVMQSELHFDGLVPPAGGSLGKLRQIQMRKIEPLNGWLTLGFEVVPEAVAEDKKSG